MDSLKETQEITLNTNCNLFSLRRIGEIHRTISTDFTPVISKCSQKSQRIFPSFNKDDKAYTPCFIIEVDNENKSKQEYFYNVLHQKKLKEALEEKLQIFLPKPSKKNSCCCVCKVPFQDYLAHIKNTQHHLNIKKSSFNKDINQMCLQFQKQQRNYQIFKQDQIFKGQLPNKKRKGNQLIKSILDKGAESFDSLNCFTKTINLETFI